MGGVTSRIYSRQHAAFFCSYPEYFLYVFRQRPCGTYDNMDVATTWKKTSFNLTDRSDFSLIDNPSIAFHALTWRIGHK